MYFPLFYIFLLLVHVWQQNKRTEPLSQMKTKKVNFLKGMFCLLVLNSTLKVVSNLLPLLASCFYINCLLTVTGLSLFNFFCSYRTFSKEGRNQKQEAITVWAKFPQIKTTVIC